MRKILFLCACILASFTMHAQTYRVFLKDKPPVPGFSSWYDIPVNTHYLNCLDSLGADVLGSSKWLNLVYINASSQVSKLISNQSWVSTLEEVNTSFKTTSNTESQAMASVSHHLNFGMAGPQLEQIGVDKLHHAGFTGENVRIALFDAGFYKIDSFHFFNKLWKNDQIIAMRDFHEGNEVFDDNWHGMSVLSTISADSPGVFMGAAYKAKFLLARTEVTAFEKHIEELYYVKAMEWADSIGVDIIHASLGYSRFDTMETDYSYKDMDGKTAIITKAAEIAFSKGILVTNSAGNEGQGSWFRITAPCDGENVLCVGAVDMNGFIAPFSSRGPSYDLRVKPDVCAMGLGTVIVNEKDSLRFAGGTSFSAPIIAGLAACLMQAHPERTNLEVLHAIRESANRYYNPDSVYGYGVPDGWKAHLLLQAMDKAGKGLSITVFPNPGEGNSIEIYVSKANEEVNLSFVNTNGQELMTEAVHPGTTHLSINTDLLSPGVYIINTCSGKVLTHTKFIKL